MRHLGLIVFLVISVGYEALAERACVNLFYSTSANRPSRIIKDVDQIKQLKSQLSFKELSTKKIKLPVGFVSLLTSQLSLKLSLIKEHPEQYFKETNDFIAKEIQSTLLDFKKYLTEDMTYKDYFSLSYKLSILFSYEPRQQLKPLLKQYQMDDKVNYENQYWNVQKKLEYLNKADPLAAYFRSEREFKEKPIPFFITKEAEKFELDYAKENNTLIVPVLRSSKIDHEGFLVTPHQVLVDLLFL